MPDMEDGDAAATRERVTFDTRIAVLAREDLETWRKLNVAAFLASGIAGEAPERLGETYLDANGHRYAAADRDPVGQFRRAAAHPQSSAAAYVRAMFSTGHDAANREVFALENAEAPDLVGLAVRGPRNDVDEATKGAKRHA